MDLKIDQHVQIVNHEEAGEAVYVVTAIRMSGATEFADLVSVDTGKLRSLPSIFLDVEYEWFREYLIGLSGEPPPG